MVADRLTESPRATMNHQPEPVFFVGLQLEKVVPAPQSCELQPTFTSADRLKPRTAQFSGIHVLRLCNDRLPFPTPAGDCLCESRQNLASGFWITQLLCSRAGCYCQHSAANVTAHCLRVDQMRSCQHHSHADVVSQMNIWHDSNLPDIRGALETPQRFRNFVAEWSRQPHSDWRQG